MNQIDRVKNRWMHVAALVGFWFLGTAVTASLTGCEGGDKHPVDMVLDPFAPPTPSEAARMAMDPADPDQRRKGVTLLSNATFGAEEPYVRLYRQYTSDPDPTVRAACYKALGRHGSVEDAPLIAEKGLDDDVAIVRWEAAKALRKIHNPDVAPALIRVATKNKDADVRMAAATALGQYPEPAVFNALVGVLDDRQFSVVQAARQSLTTLTGVDLGVDAGDWLDWASENEGRMFTGQEEYRWEPFVGPPKFFDRVQFWKKREIPEPQKPTGLGS